MTGLCDDGDVIHNSGIEWPPDHSADRTPTAGKNRRATAS
jgi:hypothetical protein